jgi:hypothetical protein
VEVQVGHQQKFWCHRFFLVGTGDVFSVLRIVSPTQVGQLQHKYCAEICACGELVQKFVHFQPVSAAQTSTQAGLTQHKFLHKLANFLMSWPSNNCAPVQPPVSRI